MKGVLTLLLFLPVLSFGQKKWTLQECIDSALINNPNIQLMDIDLSVAQINAKAANWNFLPNLNGNASHGYNWGQTIDLFTNSFATDRVRYNNFYLASSLTLFAGLRNYYDRKILHIDKDLVQANKAIEQRNLTLEILSAYLQVKLNEEIVSLKEKHLNYSQEQVKRAKLLESLQYETKRQRLESEAQETNDQYELIQTQNDLKRSNFLLQQLIGRSPESTFLTADSISLIEKPNIDESAISLLEAEKNLLQSKQVKGRLSPSLMLNGAIGSGYSENNQIVDGNGNSVPKPFSNQLNENFYQSVNITLSIPIFNGTSSYSQIAINKKEYERLKIEHEQRSNALNNTKLQNRLEVDNQRIAHKYAQASYESYKRLFEDSSVQYENGAINHYEYLQNKDAFYNAESELIQAAYRLKFAEIMMNLF